MKSKDSKDEKDNSSTGKWVATVSLLSFILSIVFSFIATETVNILPIPIAILVLLLVIALGILFDMISMAVNYAEEKEFHSKASRKLDGAKTSIKLIRNAPKVSSICADVIGDVCGIISGAVGTIIALKITERYNLPINMQVIISALVASLTIGGKAIGKAIANNNSTGIIKFVGKVVNIFKREK
jgi:CBS domain containing-hemolysin-like protein